MITRPWDYLLLSASNEEQAGAYRDQLSVRKRLGLIPQVKEVMVVPDPGGKRVGSGGSTIHCLLQVLSRELRGTRDILDPTLWMKALRGLRILIVHAGGDSRRLPPYGPCGKVFIPIPGESDRALGVTLLDRQLPAYLGLPDGRPGQGQVVVTTGDVLLTFDRARVAFSAEGVTGLGCYADPELAKNHGVFCPGEDGRVRRFLQKPTPAEQKERGAVDRHGQSVLDIGVMSFDAQTALELLLACEIQRGSSGDLAWMGPVGRAIEGSGLDFYREICCAMGTETEYGDYVRSVRKIGSTIDDFALRRIFDAVSRVPFHLCLLPRCGFLHFGTPRQLIQSGNDLLSMDYGTSHAASCLEMNNIMAAGGQIAGANSWVEGCRIDATLRLGGENVVTGVDVRGPLTLPARAVLDVLRGKDKKGGDVWFVRCYGTDDVIHKPAAEGARLAGFPLAQWLCLMDASEEDLWEANVPAEERLVWNARVFPAAPAPEGYHDWLWMLEPASASSEEKIRWRGTERFSFAEMSALAAQEEFHRRRLENRAAEVRTSLRRIFRLESGFSAGELAFIFETLGPAERAAWLADILRESCAQFGGEEMAGGLERLELSRVFHTLGSALLKLEEAGDSGWGEILAAAYAAMPESVADCLGLFGLSRSLARVRDGRSWAEAARAAAFENLSRTIVLSREKPAGHPKNALRTDEIVWGRAPARLDLGGGWSDTPPYSLEHGGCVINAAVNLNGQPPIHAYARVVEEPEIRIGSIDHGAHVVIRELDDLLDYRSPEGKFGLAKATLALCGFTPESESWPRGTRTLGDMLRLFGGGIELTTLAAIPSGSGLGTSSVMGAVLMAVVHRVIGRGLSPRELFHNVLRLEQELTTGGGWQDQVGGVLAGVKMITTEPGLIPNPRIHYVPADVLDPRTNGGQTLLYYTGLRRLAKNILHDVVGNYLDRDRGAMETVRKIHAFPPFLVEAMAAKDIRRFGELVEAGWNLKKEIDPDSTTEVIEGILRRARPYLHGAAILGAGGGGFLLFICRSADDARSMRANLEKDPPNGRARFFGFDISPEGLAVTVC